jgi:hypothetical protein
MPWLKRLDIETGTVELDVSKLPSFPQLASQLRERGISLSG